MAGIFDQFRRKVAASVLTDEAGEPERVVDDKIAFGVLLRIVAEADQKFLPQEKEKIKDVLTRFCRLSDEEVPYVLKAVEEAAGQRIDMHRFTREVGQDLRYGVKVRIIEDLFRVACADKELDNEEVETIRKIAGLLGVGHKEFIEAKIKVKKEFGIRDII